MRGSSADEFPLLSALGLYAADIRGDGLSPVTLCFCFPAARLTLFASGNCLFNALSDQIFGDQTSHSVVRARVIDYMRANADYYKQFIDVHPGGGIRRNPKRKNAGAYSTPLNSGPPPTEADVDRVFESHLRSMAKGGTYGDNMEITAFSSAYDVDVKIYQRDFAYMVTGIGGHGEDGVRPVAHIAYHMWEHYSSIRNLDGPHTGLPTVSPMVLSLEEEARQQERLQLTSHALPWQIDVVSKSLPFLADRPTIKRALEAARGDINTAVSSLLDAEEHASASSAQESSSVERDHDSGDDDYHGPNKKQDRRMSRAAKSSRTAESRHALARLATYDGSQESVCSWEDSESSSLPDSSQQSTFTPPSFDSTDSRLNLRPSDSDPPSLAAKPSIRLKLNAPKLPGVVSSYQDHHHPRVGKTAQRQSGPRISARDRRDIKKQAQKAARKERQQAVARGGANNVQSSVDSAGLALRQKGLTDTPPVETLRTLYI